MEGEKILNFLKHEQYFSQSIISIPNSKKGKENEKNSSKKIKLSQGLNRGITFTPYNGHM
jgi:hypothetical protein